MDLSTGLKKINDVNKGKWEMNQKIELQDILRLLKRQIILIIVSSLLGASLLGVYSFFTSKDTYNLQANLVLSPRNEVGFQVQDFTIYEKMLGTYIELGKTEALRKRVQEAVSLEVKQSIVSTDLIARPNSQILVVRIVGTDEYHLDSYMRRYLDVYQEMSSESLQEFHLKLLSIDSIKINRVLVKHVLNVILGFFVGIISSIVLLILSYLLQDKVKSANELSKLFDLPLLGIIPKDKSQEKIRRKKRGERHREATMEIIASPQSTMTETYRMLRSNLEDLMWEKKGQVVAVTSSIPNEGKTTTSVSLAVAFAQINKKVLLIDADLRKPTIHHYLNLRRGPGLSDALRESALIGRVFQEVKLPSGIPLSVLSSGTSYNMPTELLEGNLLSELLESARSEFDIIIVDTPPILAVTDAQVIARQADGLLLVSDINVVKKSELQEINRILETSFKNVYGLVANKIDNDYNPYYYYEY